MRAEDVTRVAQLELENFSEPWSEAQLYELLERPEYCYLVAVEGDLVFGYAGMLVVGEEGQITNIATAKEARSRGIGKELLARLIDAGKRRGAEAFSLEVRDSNVPAIALYEQMGFQLAGVRKGFYRKPTEDGRIYWYPSIP